MSYTALKALKVQKTRPDGTVYLDQRKPGDAVPEAADWRDLPRWIRTGYVAPAKGVTVDPNARGVYKSPVSIVASGVVTPAAEIQKAADVIDEVMQARKELEAMSKKEVIKIARDLKIKLDKDKSKGDFIAAILATDAKD